MMKSILFPTDFSSASLNAFGYAVKYAEKTQARLVVYHSFMPDTELNEETREIYKKLDIENFRSKKDKFPPFEKLIEQLGVDSVTVKYIVEEGAFIENFKAYVKRKEDAIELVVIGSQAAKKGMFEVFLETNTAIILEEINKPVIAVPQRARFDGVIDHIAFLVDYREDERAPLTQVMKTCREFGAKLHVLHFDLAHGESIVPLMERFKKSLRVPPHTSDTVFRSIDTINLKASLADYCRANHIDLVCLVNHKRNFYQRLFSYSLAQDLLRNIDVPVMAIYND
ncbi:Universal stress protein family protein [Parapedobacter composti]|uniref:Universal stress protein family protein n=1 Tax=Parapedobacter composti TaxID=623281 RepID=A0A1I1HM93_9SPHI|nr:universal stress protein [Parapedobacter composti]SFC24981.1 Universal stress protein family protein [Parapedobacter composti]